MRLTFHYLCRYSNVFDCIVCSNSPTLLLQNSVPQETASSETQKKPRRQRRYGRKRKSLNPNNEATASIDPIIVNPSQTTVSPCKVNYPSKSPVSKEVKETPADRSFSNNISRSYMDKMKREDDGKSRDSVLAEREARRTAKQKVQDKGRNLANASPTKSIQKQEPMAAKKIDEKVGQTPSVTQSQKLEAVVANPENKSEKSREDVIAERELKKQAKLAKKTKTTETVPAETGISTTTTTITTESIAKKLENVTISEKPVLSKAERREKQEAQRAAKAKLLADKAEKVQKPVQSTDIKSKTGKVDTAKEISVRIENCLIDFDALMK